MLDIKQIRMLELLDKQVSKCNKCYLHSNGFSIPHWTPYSQYAIIGESPSNHEIRENNPFVGANRILAEELSNVGFNSDDFLIINTIQCRTNGKPTEDQILNCQDYLRKYLKVIQPEKILCLGNYAKYIFTGYLYGVLKQRGHFMNADIGDGYVFPVLFTVHPAYCIYNDEEGRQYLKADIALFKEKRFERKFDNWLLTENDFLI